MDFLLEILEKPFTQLRLEQQILAALIILLCLGLVVLSAAWVVNRIKKNRSSWRHRLVSPIDVSWEERPGVKRQERGCCLDVSTGGLKMELPESIAAGSPIYFQVLHTNLAGTASVRYCTRSGSKYVIGVEFGSVATNPTKPAT